MNKDVLQSKKNSQPVIELQNVAFGYQGVEVLRSINLTIRQGEKVALLGANGSGKSTLLKILDGLVFVTGGTYRAFGNSIDQNYFSDEHREHAFRRQVGYIFQDSDVQLFSATVWDEVAFAPLQMELPKHEVVSRASQALELMGITHLRDRLPHQLSGGEKKKVAISSVLSYGPSVWLFDEPTAGLDPRSQSRLIDFIYEMNVQKNTVITATHDLSLLNEIADRVIVLSEDHTIVADGPPEKIVHDTALLKKHNLIHDHAHRHQKKQHTHIHTHYTSHTSENS